VDFDFIEALITASASLFDNIIIATGNVARRLITTSTPPTALLQHGGYGISSWTVESTERAPIRRALWRRSIRPYRAVIGIYLGTGELGRGRRQAQQVDESHARKIHDPAPQRGQPAGRPALS
jgi:hypothetical protein